MGWSYQQKPPMGWPLDYDSGLVPDAGFWPMPEGSGNIVQDLSGNGRVGALDPNPPSWVFGECGPALDFDNGNSQDITISPSVNVGTVWTVVVSLNIDTVGGAYDGILGESGTYSIYNLNGKMTIYDAGNRSQTGSLTVGTWNHVAFVATGNGFEIYHNGVLDSGALAQSAHSWNFAYIGSSTGGKEYFDGKISDISVYNRALSAFEIAQLYQESFCMFMNPGEVALLGGYQAAPVGMSGAMTTNPGIWGW